MALPDKFKERMQKLLGEEYDVFLDGYGQPAAQALRVNTGKIAVSDFLRMNPFTLQPVPWAETGFYYGENDRPGKHVYHEAGLYYIQEPSAMAVGELTHVQPGERVLDLCAAPGGKTTHLAAAMQGRGLLVSNEIHPVRARVLAQNVERMGIAHAIVTNETPARLAERFPYFFDRIVVDAPCSGEGMFRKDPDACEQWSPEQVTICAKRQREILGEAARMLAPGGTIVYSTCTFAPEENEGTIGWFLENYPDFHAVREEPFAGWFAPGRPKCADAPEETSSSYRLWPHKLRGEGHFAAVLVREGSRNFSEESFSRKSKGKNGKPKRGGKSCSPLEEAVSLYDQFSKAYLEDRWAEKLSSGEYVLFGDNLWLLPENLDLSGLKVLRAGLELGTVRKNRFEPAHALAIALSETDAKNCCHLTLPEEDDRAVRYLWGESIRIDEPGSNGWCLVLADGYPLGWGKRSGDIVKNHYPKGLRKDIR